MTIMPDHAHPLVRAAVTALDPSGATTPHQARTLLGMWARRTDLSDAQVADVLAHYEGTDPAGYGYSRDHDGPTGSPLPPGVAGYRVGRGHQGGAR